MPDPNALDTVIRTYTYDRANRKLTEFPGGYYTYTWSYDAAGNVLVDGKTGATTTYDALGRPAIRVGIDSARFVYDEMGQLLHAINGPARIHRHYAKNGTLSTDSTQLAANNFADQNYSSYVSSFVPRYDLNGRRTVLVMGADSIRYHYVAQWGALDTLTDPFGHKFAWQYDNDGRVSQLTRYAERMDTTVVEQTTYDVDSRLARRTIMRGATALLRDTLVYDRRGKVVRNAWAGDSIAYTPLGHLRYGSYANATGSEGYVLDAAGNRVSKVHSYIQTFAYDPHTDLLRTILQSASFSWDTVSYGYDSKGNQVSEIHITPFSHVTGGIIDTAKEQRITASAYTGGLMTASTYTLDTIPQYPLHYQIYQRKESYRYDALGRRVWVELVRDTNCTHHDTSSDCSNYVRRVFWDGSQILHETQVAADTGAWDPVKEGGSVTYVHGGTIDQPLEVYKASTNIVVPYVNWRGQFVTGTCPLAGCSGVTFPLADASAFDDLQDGDATGTWFGTLIKGQIDASGYEYKRNRYYNPGTGRFTQEDPIGLAGGLNVYGYANGDPANYGDPFGLCSNPGAPGLGGLQCALEDVWGAIIHGPGLLLQAINDPLKGGFIGSLAMVPLTVAEGPEEGAAKLTQWGWTGSAKWRAAVTQIGQPLTHLEVVGKIPDKAEAVELIKEAGGVVNRIEEEGHAVGGVSSHTFPHINYTTADGAKATVQISVAPK